LKPKRTLSDLTHAAAVRALRRGVGGQMKARRAVPDAGP